MHRQFKAVFSGGFGSARARRRCHYWERARIAKTASDPSGKILKINDLKIFYRPKNRPVCTENLNPDVMVMKAAEDGVRFDASDPLNGARDRRIFIQ